MNIFVDLEMQSMQNATENIRRIWSRETIEIGAVMLDDRGKTVSSYRTYVKPQYSSRITPKITALTGITTGQVVGAVNFEKAFHEFMQWCCQQEDPKVYAWGDSDLQQLQMEAAVKNVVVSEAEKAVFNSWHDLQAEFDELAGIKDATGLEKAVNLCGLQMTGKKHDAYWDAMNKARVFKAVSDKDGFLKSLRLMKEVVGYEERPVTLGSMIDFSAFRVSA